MEHQVLAGAAKSQPNARAQYARFDCLSYCLWQSFSLHAAMRCHANERLKLERLCRCITRPALANDRIKINSKGQVELKL